MCKCKIIALSVLIIFMSSCSNKDRSATTFLDTEKLCGENKNLVEKMMSFSSNDFVQQDLSDIENQTEEVWDLKPDLAKRYDLDWLQLRFEHGKLSAVWFGERSDLDSDLKRIGLKRDSLKKENGGKITDFSEGLFYSEDLAQRQIQIEHEGGPQKGTTVTCFDLKTKN